jgi:uncharacterized delta-60 repeat protein
MMKRCALLAALVVIVLPAVLSAGADTAWVRRYNGPGNSGDEATAIKVDASGNVYVAGYSAGITSAADWAVIKYLPNGDTAWLRRANGLGNGDDEAYAIAVDASGNVIVTGYTTSAGGNVNYGTIKFLPNGDLAWVKEYDGPGNGSDAASALAVDAAGNVYVTGYSTGSGTDLDFATIKYLPNGDTAWVRRFNGLVSGQDAAFALAVDASGNVYVTGYCQVPDYLVDCVTVKYLPNGTQSWVRSYNGPASGIDYGSALAIDASGNVLLTGRSQASNNYWDCITIKYLPTGDTAWVRRYNGPGNNDDCPSALAVDASGNVYVTGYTRTGSDEDYATIKYLPNGTQSWVQTYNGPGNSYDRAAAVAVDRAGNAYVTGYSTGLGATEDYATIKYLPNGDTACLMRYNGPSNSSDEAYAIAVDSSGNVYVTGGSIGSGSGWDYVTIKYVTPPEAFSLLSPPDYASNVPFTGTLTWQTSVGAAHYYVSLGTATPPPVVDSVSDTTYAYSELLGSTTYHWSVTAKNAGGTTKCSSDFGFTTAAAAPLGWQQLADLPLGIKNKGVKDGGCLAAWTSSDTDFVYALKGNNRLEFYRYNRVTNTWQTLESIPLIGSSGRKKAVKKGATLAKRFIEDPMCFYCGTFANKGNGTLEWWFYDPTLSGTSTYPWSEKAPIPAGAKPVKEGSGATSVRIGETTCVYFLKGSGTQEFYRYNTVTNTWEPRADAPLGLSGKPFKKGSCLADGDPNATALYVLKGGYNEFYAYDIATNTWATLSPLPLIGSIGRKKKAGDGAELARAGGNVFALKGNNTLEFWFYDLTGGAWTQLADMPLGGGKKVKGGGALTHAFSLTDGTGSLYATKGNNTLEFYDYPLTDLLALTTPATSAAGNSTLAGELAHPRHPSLVIGPNPFTNATTISYSLPQTGNISLRLYDVTGTLVITLTSGYHNAGASSFNVNRSSFARGIYLLELETENSCTTSKLIIE